jgi:hypothetical protein
MEKGEGMGEYETGEEENGEWRWENRRMENGVCAARAAAYRSLTVSVLPVPAGPCGSPPRWRWSAVVSVV